MVNCSQGRVLVTSMLLNLRSRQTNYHQVLNSLLFWDNQVPKRLVHIFNRLGITSSYPFQGKAITFLSKDAINQARMAANDNSKIKMLPYDNFNWTSRAWESTALHKSITHDEVSALLVILPVPDGCEAHQITAVKNFARVTDTRHTLSPRKSLISILPNAQDQQIFREHSILHILHILTEEIEDFSKYSTDIPAFSDPNALAARQTEEYYLPTFDQEQGSTRGNMVVLEHYFGKVLEIPKDVFETEMFTVLGDRLTTVRDRAAQDQRAVDRSLHRFDHLASFSMVSGLMHFSLNFIQAIAGNYWGQEAHQSPITLSTFRKILPNRADINNRKFDYYGWLRFLDVILRSLVIQATLQVSKTETYTTLGTQIPTYQQLVRLATSVVDRCLLPSTDRLEADGIKTLKGNTHCGNAVLLMHDLMTLREMQHAVKHGHPDRIKRMIKYWLPMFYAAGSHNYANECMELLHNITHDWPPEYAKVAFNGMLVNPSGKVDGWKPTDIRVEHLNDKIKEHAHGPNATPDVLEKISPALGHLQQLSGQLFQDIGVEAKNQKHAKVSQQKDVEIASKHLHKHKVFDFASDTPSNDTFVDLYRSGGWRLSGADGGHAKHLKRNLLRLRSRHRTDAHDILFPNDEHELQACNRELVIASDVGTMDYRLVSEDGVSESGDEEECGYDTD